MEPQLPAPTLRKQLDLIGKKYPGHKDIVVGNSMGGMMSRLLISDSNMTLWNNAFDKPPGEMGFDDHTRQILSDSLTLKVRPDVSRVIYASASHRDSESTTNFLGRLGAKIVRNPVAGNTISNEAIDASRREFKRVPNSIDVLDPDSPFLAAVDTFAPDPSNPEPLDHR